MSRNSQSPQKKETTDKDTTETPQTLAHSPLPLPSFSSCLSDAGTSCSRGPNPLPSPSTKGCFQIPELWLVPVFKAVPCTSLQALLSFQNQIWQKACPPGSFPPAPGETECLSFVTLITQYSTLSPDPPVCLWHYGLTGWPSESCPLAKRLAFLAYMSISVKLNE